MIPGAPRFKMSAGSCSSYTLLVLAPLCVIGAFVEYDFASPTSNHGDSHGRSVSISQDGSCLAIGTPQSGTDYGYATTWFIDFGAAPPFHPYVVAYSSTDMENFGASLAFSGDASVLAVGANNRMGTSMTASPQGAVFICKFGHYELKQGQGPRSFCHVDTCRPQTCAVLRPEQIHVSARTARRYWSRSTRL